MERLIYSVLGSLDGYLNDAGGAYDWAVPGEDLIGHLNDSIRDVSTYLYGRRMYEELKVWETDPSLADSPETEEFARIWQAADKVVFSRTLTEPQTARTRIERNFDADLVRGIVADAPGDVTIDGARIGAEALRAGVVDEIHRYTAPVVVGGGTPLFPAGLRLDLELVETWRFDRGMTGARYRVR